MSMKSLMYMKALEKGYPQRFWIISYTSLRICCHCYSLGHVNEIINVNEGPLRKATPKGSGSLPTPPGLHLAQDLLPLLFLGTLFCVMLNINGIQIPVIRIYM